MGTTPSGPLVAAAFLLSVYMEKHITGAQDGLIFSLDNFINPFVREAQLLQSGTIKHVVRELTDIRRPSYVLATIDHQLFISSFLLNQVLVVNDVHSRYAKAVTFAGGHGLDGPWGMVDYGGLLYVASFATDQIYTYNRTTGELVMTFGNEFQLDCPEGMTLGPDKLLYVTSFLDDKLVRFTLKGQFVGKLLGPGRGLKGPEDVTFLPSGRLLVSSHFADSILEVDLRSDVVVGEFARVEKPVGLTVGFDGHLYVTSYTTNSIVRFHGHTGERFGLIAIGKGMNGPTSVSFASERTLYCSSYDGNRVVVFNNTATVRLTSTYQ